MPVTNKLKMKYLKEEGVLFYTVFSVPETLSTVYRGFNIRPGWRERSGSPDVEKFKI